VSTALSIAVVDRIVNYAPANLEIGEFEMRLVAGAGEPWNVTAGRDVTVIEAERLAPSGPKPTGKRGGKPRPANSLYASYNSLQ
jgi:hypothetical protein